MRVDVSDEDCLWKDFVNHEVPIPLQFKGNTLLEVSKFVYFKC